MSEDFEIRFSEQGAKDVVASMREVNAEATGAARKVEDLSTSLSRVKAKADPAGNAYEQLAKNLDILQRSTQANLITGAQQERLSASLIRGAEGQLRPFSSLISSINAETNAWKLNGAARSAALRTQQQSQALQRAGIALNTEEAASLERTNLAYAQQREATLAAEQAERTRAAEAVRASAAAEAAIKRESAALERRNSIVAGVLAKNRGETAALGSGGGAVTGAQLRTIQQVEALKKSGVTLTEEENAELIKTNEAYAAQRAELTRITALKRQLASVRQIGGNPVAEATNRYNNARSVVSQAGNAGLLGAGEQAALEKQLTSAFAAQTNPLVRSNQLLAQRAEYQTGLFNSGRALAQVERDIARAQELGIVGSAGEIASLRAQAREIDHVEAAYAKINSVKGLFNSTIGGIGLLFGGEEIVHTLDQVQNVQNLLSVTSKGAGNQASVTQAVYDIAQKTHSEVEDTAKLYSRIDLTVAHYGYSQQQVLTLTQEVNEQLRLSATSTGESSRATLDFIHAISNGQLQFRELRALTAQAPFVAKSIADGLTKLAQLDSGFRARATKAGVDISKGINVSDLRTLTSKKALGSGDVFSAEKLQVADTENAFKKLSPTISQAITDVHTAFTHFVSDFNQGTGVAAGLANVIEFLANHLKEIIPALAIIGSLMAGIFVKNLIQETSSAFKVFSVNLLSSKSATEGLALSTAGDTSAINGNNAALETQNVLLSKNRAEMDLSTQAAARNAGVRGESSIAGGAQGFGRRATQAAPSAAGAALGVGQLRGVGQAANAASGIANDAKAVSGIGGAFNNATGAASKFYGVIRTGASGIASGVAGIVGGLAEAVPLVFALGAAWLLLKDNINVAKDQTLVYSQDGIGQVIKGNITLGDVVGGVFQSITGGAQASSDAQVKASQDTSAAGIAAAKKQSDATIDAFNKTNGAFNSLQSGLIKGIVNLVGAFTVGALSIQNFWNNMIDAIYEHVLITFRKIANVFIDLYNNSIVPLANAGKAVGIGGGLTPLGHSTVGVGPVFAGGQTAAQRAGIRASNLDSENRNIRNVIAANVLNTAGSRTAGRGTGVGQGDDGDEPFSGKDKKKKGHVDPLIAKFEELTKQLLPAIEAIQKFTDEMKTLKQATDKGLVTKLRDEINKFDKEHPGENVAGTKTGQIDDPELIQRFTDAAKQHLQDAVNPTGVFERDNRERIQQIGPGGSAIGKDVDTSKFQLEISQKVYEQEKREADQRKLTIATIEQLDGARIKASVTAVAEAELIAKINDAISTNNEDQKRALSQIGETTELIKAQSDAYAIYKEGLQSANPLIVKQAQDGYDATVKTNLATIAYTENVDKTKAAYEKIIAPAKEYRDTVVDLNNLLAAGQISLSKYNEELRDGTAKALAANKDAMSGFQEAILDIKKKSEDTAADTKQVFTDAYDSIEDTFVGIFTGADIKKSIQKGLGQITGDLAKGLFHKVTDPLISDIGQKAGIKGFGDKAIQATRADITATTVYVTGQSTVAGSGQAPAYTPGQTTGVTPNINSTGNPANDNFLQKAFGVSNLNPASSLLNGTGSLTGITGPTAANSLGNVGSNIVSLFGGSGATPTGGLNGIQALSGLGGGAPPAAAAGGGGGLFGGLSSLLGGGGGGGGLSSLLGGLGGGGSAAAGAAGGAGGLGSLFSTILPLFGLRDGGTFDVPGHGAGADSKVVAFKATPGENVAVTTPGQQRDAKSAAPVQVNQKIVNVMDPQAAVDAMNTTAGQKVILNHIQSNPEAFKRALGSG